eukprot:15360801-Ditylum_brightwellii.AAC.1
MAIIQPVMEDILKEVKANWHNQQDETWVDFLTLVELIEKSLKPIVNYTIASKNNQLLLDDVMNNLNMGLIRLEEFVRGNYKESVREKFPTMSITIKESLETLKEQAEDARELLEQLSSQQSGINTTREVSQQEKQQTLKVLSTKVGEVQDVQSMAFESREICKVEVTDVMSGHAEKNGSEEFEHMTEK